MGAHRSHVAVAVGLLAAALGALSGSAGHATAATPTRPHFVVAPLPNPAGVTTPRNEDVEPGIGIDGAGAIWIGSNILGNPRTSHDPRVAPAVGDFSGEDFWKSTDGGRTFQWVSDPYGLTGPSSFGLGGEDSDATAAPEKNSSGFYNVYGVSLYLAGSTLASSQDGGATFQLLRLGGVPAQDRPWVSADGACTVYLTYHQLPLFLPVVNTYDVCSSTTIVSTPTPTIDPTRQTQLFTTNSLPGASSDFNKPMVDTWPSSPHRHNLYVPMEACNLQTPQDYANNAVTSCPGGVNAQIEVAVSSDGGSSFTTKVVGLTDNSEEQGWSPTVTVGPDGSVDVAWSDNHNAFTSASHDGGSTWSAPRRVNTAPVAAAVYPTIAAGSDGHVDIAYYGSPRAGDSNDASAMGTPGDPKAAPWRLYLSRSTNGGTSFQQYAVSGVIHTGVLCTQGSNCLISGSRDLYDDFGVAVSPTTGLTTVAFDADQPPTGAPADTAVEPYTAYATELPVASAVPATSIRKHAVAAVIGGTPTTSAAAPDGAAGAGLALVGVVLVAGRARRRRRA